MSRRNLAALMRFEARALWSLVISTSGGIPSASFPTTADRTIYETLVRPSAAKHFSAATAGAGRRTCTIWSCWRPLGRPVLALFGVCNIFTALPLFLLFDFIIPRNML